MCVETGFLVFDPNQKGKKPLRGFGYYTSHCIDHSKPIVTFGDVVIEMSEDEEYMKLIDAVTITYDKQKMKEYYSKGYKIYHVMLDCISFFDKSSHFKEYTLGDA
jgi:3-hydroxy-3-methylglutaryl CoA synthase